MGSVLSSPVTLIRVQRHGSSAFACGVAEMQGWRKGHEDAHDIRCDDTTGAFWVLDGHGGSGASLFAAPELGRDATEARSGGSLPSTQRIEEGLSDVDKKLRLHFKEHPDQESGSTVVGSFIALQQDGTYSLKLVNCGDSRALVLHGPQEQQDGCPAAEVVTPQYLLDLCDQEDQVAQGHAAKICAWPLVQETIDHKPSHPTEAARIVAAGGHVSKDDPPRVDGNLAVSRGLGDFEFKAADTKSDGEQKVSCVPDVYEVSGMRQGSFCVLCCDGVWDVLSAEEVCTLVRDSARTETTDGVDVGGIAAQIVQTSLDKGSRDNITAMVVHLAPASPAWAKRPPLDEIRGFEKLLGEDAALDAEVRKESLAFLRRADFPPEPCVCKLCQRWLISMQQCPCGKAFYCSRECQKKDWPAHKLECEVVAPRQPSQAENTDAM